MKTFCTNYKILQKKFISCRGALIKSLHVDPVDVYYIERNKSNISIYILGYKQLDKNL